MITHVVPAKAGTQVSQRGSQLELLLSKLPIAASNTGS